jgi:hypothetical protein
MFFKQVYNSRSKILSHKATTIKRIEHKMYSIQNGSHLKNIYKHTIQSTLLAVMRKGHYKCWEITAFRTSL